MEDIRGNKINNNDNNQPATTTIVSTMTTVTGNGTNVTLITPETVDNFEPDPKWEMTTLEKASYEPTAQAQEQPEDRSVFDPCILSQSSVDTQLEKVIDDIVELDRCQQFVQSTDHHQNVTLDKEKEVANIQRWISGNYSEESEKATNINEKVQQDSKLENSEQQTTSATLQQSNHDLKQSDNITIPESNSAIQQQTMNDQDLPKIEALSSDVEMDEMVTVPPVENKQKTIQEIADTKVVDFVNETTGNNEGDAIVTEIDIDAVEEVIETKETRITSERTCDYIESGVAIEEREAPETVGDQTDENGGEKADSTNEAVVINADEMGELTETIETAPFQTSNIAEDEAETKEEEATDSTVEDKKSEIDGNEASIKSPEVVAPDMRTDDASEVDEIGFVVQEKSSEKIEGLTEAAEETAFKNHEEKISEVAEKETSIASDGDGVEKDVPKDDVEEKEVPTNNKEEASNNVEPIAPTDVGEGASEKVEREKLNTIESEVSDNVKEKSFVQNESRTRGTRLAKSSSEMKRKASTSISPVIRRRSKRAKVECEPQVDAKVEEKVAEKTDDRLDKVRLPKLSSTNYTCTHCEYGSSRLDNTIYHMKHKMCKPLQKMWNEKCENYKRQMTPQKSSSSGRKRTTR